MPISLTVNEEQDRARKLVQRLNAPPSLLLSFCIYLARRLNSGVSLTQGSRLQNCLRNNPFSCCPRYAGCQAAGAKHAAPSTALEMTALPAPQRRATPTPTIVLFIGCPSRFLWDHPPLCRDCCQCGLCRRASKHTDRLCRSASIR